MAREPPSEELLTGDGFWGKKNQLRLRKWSTVLLWVTHTLGYMGSRNWVDRVIFKRCHEVGGLQVNSGSKSGRSRAEDGVRMIKIQSKHF